MSTSTAVKGSRAEAVLHATAGRFPALEAEREALRQRVKQQLKVIGTAAVLISLILWVLLGEPGEGLAILVIVMATAYAAYLLYRGQKQWEQRVLDEVIPEVCSALHGLEYQAVVTSKDYLAPYETLGLVGESNDPKLTHYFKGSHHGVGFECVHANLQNTSGKSKHTTPVFEGLLFRIQVPVNIDARILILPNAGVFSKRRDMAIVPLGNPAFDEKFVVSHEMSNSHGEALIRSVITPEFQSALLRINARESDLAYGRSAITAGMIYDSLYLALTRFKLSSSIGPVKIERPQAFLSMGFFMRANSGLETSVSEMVKDIETVYRIIEELDAAFAVPDIHVAGESVQWPER
ncbi:DUF3137 domain-containing protein [Nitrincola alkalilacustris]|uniref:DUF3137 domain-containing protein n=1 Tax=Nitrincola alkalilacustris TaxID=1571224 RepID=UPI00124F7134|nr:DUF3137 domain-containing protein [Nitrincola alkalilacustris]